MAEFRQFSKGIGQGNNGAGGANSDAFAAVNAFVFDYICFTLSDSDRLGRADTHTLHPTIAFFCINANKMQILAHSPSIL